MSNRISMEARIINYFETASTDKIEIMFDLVRNIIKRRQPRAKKAKEKVTSIGKAKEPEVA